MNIRELAAAIIGSAVVVAAMGGLVLPSDPAGIATAASLYERLGGLASISVVVSDVVDELIPDAVIDARPADTRLAEPAYLKYRVTAMLCKAAGGPCAYRGRGSNDAHRQLNLSEHEWNRMVTILKYVLERHEVGPAETAELLAIIDSAHDDIVTAQAVAATTRWR